MSCMRVPGVDIMECLLAVQDTERLHHQLVVATRAFGEGGLLSG